MQNSTVMETQQSKSPPDQARSGYPALWPSLVVIAFLLPMILASGMVVLFQVNQWNLPNVHIYENNVGWLTPDETARLIDRAWNLDRKIHVVPANAPEEALWLSPQDLGYWIDATATAELAFRVGRAAEPFKEVLAVLRGEEKILLPIVYFDEITARKTLEQLAADLDNPSKEPAVAYQDGKWIALPGEPGRMLDIDSTLEYLYTHAFTNLITQTVPLSIQTIVPVQQDLSFLLADIEKTVEQEMRLSAYDPINDESFSWYVPTETKRGWIQVDSEASQVEFSIPRMEVKTLLSAWESEMGNERGFQENIDWDALIEALKTGEQFDITIVHHPTTYQVGAGESLWSISLKLGMPMWYILDANPDLTVNNLTAGMMLNIPSKNVLLPLPPVPNKRIVIDLSDQHMTVYENGQAIKTHIVSTGVSDSPTMAGIFQVQTHIINAYASNWDLYMPHFLGIYEAWPGFMNGIHGLPLLSSGSRLWASSLGSPASYGCIILDLAAAEALYYWADPGVVVEIIR